MAPKKKTSSTNPFLNAQSFEVLNESFVRDDASRFTLREKGEVRITTIPITLMAPLSIGGAPNVQPALPNGIDQGSDVAKEILLAHFTKAENLRKTSFKECTYIIDPASLASAIDGFNAAIQKHEKKDQLLDTLNSIRKQQTVQMTEALDVDFAESDGCKTKKPFSIEENSDATYSIAEALARFVPHIMAGKLLAGKRKQGDVRAFVARHVFGLPHQLPETGSSDAIFLFHTNVLSKLIAVSDKEMVCVLNNSSGLPMTLTKSANHRGKMSLPTSKIDATDGLYTNHTIDAVSGASFVPNHDLFYSIAFPPNFPNVHGWSDLLDSRLLRRFNSTMLDVVKKCAEVLLGSEDTWPAIFKRFVDENSSNSTIDEVANAGAFYKKHYDFVFSSTDDKEAVVQSYKVKPYRAPSNNVYMWSNGSQTLIPSVLSYDTTGDKAKVEQQFAASGKHDAEIHTAPSFGKLLMAVERLFDVFLGIDGSKLNALGFHSTALTSKKRTLVEDRTDDDDDVRGGGGDDDSNNNQAKTKPRAKKAPRVASLGSKLDDLTSEIGGLKQEMAVMHSTLADISTLLASVAEKTKKKNDDDDTQQQQQLLPPQDEDEVLYADDDSDSDSEDSEDDSEDDAEDSEDAKPAVDPVDPVGPVDPVDPVDE